MTNENETLLAVDTAYVQGEDVAARGRVVLYALGRSENPQNLVSEVYSKGIERCYIGFSFTSRSFVDRCWIQDILHKWTGSESFFDAPPLHVVSLNILEETRCSAKLAAQRFRITLLFLE